MSEHIDQFCENLRIKLTNIDNNMESLKSKIDSKARTAEQDVRRHLDGVKKRIEQDRGNVAAAQADIKKWIEERKATASEKVAELKAKRETAQLQNRANSAERYAAGAAVVALAAIDEAERASLEAWLARKDAENTQGTKAA
jgi:predicted  nucleic acid-binding Zn-ribbon protein